MMATGDFLEVVEGRLDGDLDEAQRIVREENRGTSSMSQPAPKLLPVSQPWWRNSTFIVGYAVFSFALAVFSGVQAWQGWFRPTPPPADPSVQTSASALAKELRDGRNYRGAIDLLSLALDRASEPAQRSQILRDRAYCYKLLGEWNPSIKDLTSALTETNTIGDKVAILDDRAYAHLQLRDIEAAIADYDAANQFPSGNPPSAQRRDLLRVMLTPTMASALFVFVDPADITRAEQLPLRIRQLYPDYQLNVRYWWSRIPKTELRVTSADDRPAANRMRNTLNAWSYKIDEPTVLPSPPERTSPNRVVAGLETQCPRRHSMIRPPPARVYRRDRERPAFAGAAAGIDLVAAAGPMTACGSIVTCTSTPPVETRMVMRDADPIVAGEAAARPASTR